MRMKFKPWAREELETSPFYIENPEEYKNRWKETFEKEQTLHLELGCGEKDNIERIYINFCNPWPRGKHHKKRLTHERQLEQYKKFLKGQIFFKTDDDGLFEATIKSLQRSGYGIEKITYDLANEENFWNGEKNIETEHEKMFKEQNIKIKALIANYN